MGFSQSLMRVRPAISLKDMNRIKERDAHKIISFFFLLALTPPLFTLRFREGPALSGNLFAAYRGILACYCHVL